MENHYRKHIFFCTNQKSKERKSCAAGGSVEFYEYAERRVRELGLNKSDGVRVSKTSCLGRCSLGPSVVVYPDAVWYSPTNERDIERIIIAHLTKNIVVHDLLMRKPDEL